jgi:hypothetical protein
VFILSFHSTSRASDTLVKHNALLGYDVLDMLIGYGWDMDKDMGSVLIVSVTHARLRVSGSYPSSVCLAKLTISCAAHAFRRI